MGIVQPGQWSALCAPFALAVWIAFTHQRRAMASKAPYAHTESAALDPTRIRFEAETVDLESALWETATALGSVARAHWVKIDVAVHAGMTVCVDPSALRIALREAMLSAIRRAAGGQVLVTAANLGSQLHIRVIDDGLGADQQGREMLMRGAEASIALQGGSIAVEARPGRGTTVVVRLPLPGDVRYKVSGLDHFPVPASRLPEALPMI